MLDQKNLSPGNLIENISKLKQEAINDLDGASSLSELVLLKAKYFGKKSILKDILSQLKSIDAEQKKQVAKSANECKEFISNLLKEKENSFGDVKAAKATSLDYSLPGKRFFVGSLHPITTTARAILRSLEIIGFKLVLGPEVEHDYYNFEALNIPKSHPARDMQDTFYIDEETLLRTHTSPVQIRAMLANKNLPIRIMSFGRVYRKDEDVSHSPMFHQVEALYVGKGVSLADLKNTLLVFLGELFQKDVNIRMRPSYFPFTEPSIEVDISCLFCEADSKKSECKLCKGTGFIEIMGAGLVDPEVLKAVNIDHEIYSGFAFGIGVERVCLLRHQIPDIRLLFENDARLLSQF